MKSTFLGIFLIAAVVFGGLYFQQVEKTRRTEALVTKLQQQAGDQDARLDRQEKQVAGLRTKLAESRAEAQTRASAALEFLQAQTNAVKADAEKTNAEASNPLSAMLKDPGMKEMIKNQQKVALGAVIDKNYAKLFADLHLSPEQSASLKDLIMNKMMAGMDLGMSMFADDLHASALAEQVAQLRPRRSLVVDNESFEHGILLVRRRHVREHERHRELHDQERRDQHLGAVERLDAGSRLQRPGDELVRSLCVRCRGAVDL